MTILKAFRIEESLAKKLAQLAEETQRTEKYFVQEALEHYFSEYEDCRIGKERFHDPKSKVITSKEMRKRLGV